MKTPLILLALVLPVAALAGTNQPNTPTDLQGEWKIVSQTNEGKGVKASLLKEYKVVITKNQVTVYAPGATFARPYTIDPKTTPASIDYTEIKVGGRVVQKSVKGIWKLEKGTLTTCLPVSDNRPTDFVPTKDNSVVVMERVKK